MAVRRNRKPVVKSDPALYAMANAIREVLGLGDIPYTTPEWKYVLEDDRIFYAQAWSFSSGGRMTSRCGGAL